jgi:hypothetical protein
MTDASTFHRSSTALVVQDPQNDVVTEGGTFAASGAPGHAPRPFQNRFDGLDQDSWRVLRSDHDRRAGRGNGVALGRFSVICVTPPGVITPRSPVQGSCVVPEHLCLTRPYAPKARTLAGRGTGTGEDHYPERRPQAPPPPGPPHGPKARHRPERRPPGQRPGP